jgi:hypothetical protein
MVFSRVGNTFIVARTTGPTHNLLGLEFHGHSGLSGVVVHKLQSPGTPESGGLPEDQVRDAALAGVEDANKEMGTSYAVKRVEYIPADSPPVDIYRYLAKCIVERLEKRESFG